MVSSMNFRKIIFHFIDEIKFNWQDRERGWFNPIKSYFRKLDE